MKTSGTRAAGWRESREGFTLLEALLAMLVFSLAVISLVEAINTMGKASVESRMELAIQARLDDLMLLTTRKLGGMPQGGLLHQQERTVVEDGVTYIARVDATDFKSARGEKLTNIYRVQIVARWDEDGRAQEKEAESLVWPPLFAAPEPGAVP